MSILPNQLQTFYLAGSGVIATATSITLKSMLTIDGATLTMADFGTIAYATIDPGNSTLEEQISFSGLTNNSNGTVTLTGVKTVLFGTPFTETSGLAKAHAGSAPLVISNTSGFHNQYPSKINDETITGQWTFTSFPITPTNSDASTTVKGVTKLSTAPASATEPIAVGTNDTRVPTADPTTLFSNIRGQIRVASTASNTSPQPNVSTTDVYILTALAGAPTFGIPTGSPVQGQKLIIRIKDDGTPRAITWNSIYRASSDLALPTTTVTSKTLYCGFIYNDTDTKWDLLAVLNNF